MLIGPQENVSLTWNTFFVTADRVMCEMFTAPQIRDFDPSTIIGKDINLAASSWRKVQTLKNKLIQTIWMNVSHHTRYIALARKGFINLVEVEIFKTGKWIGCSLIDTSCMYHFTWLSILCWCHSNIAIIRSKLHSIDFSHDLTWPNIITTCHLLSPAHRMVLTTPLYLW